MKSQLQRPMSRFLKDLDDLSQLATTKKHAALALTEYPFDLQLLSNSRLYRTSRIRYLSKGGQFNPRVCSTMRSLSTQNIFNDKIEYSPIAQELLWFRDHYVLLTPKEMKKQHEALAQFNDIAVFHEQNHRLVWALLPPPPDSKRDICRYLNFAESLVVMLDLALADELKLKKSEAFNRLNLILRPAARSSKFLNSKSKYRSYLIALFCVTYMILEFVESKDLLKAVNYILPGQKEINQLAVRRSLELNESFVKVTNPQWQNMYWSFAKMQLNDLHASSSGVKLILPEDPLDLDLEIEIVERVLKYFELV